MKRFLLFVLLAGLLPFLSLQAQITTPIVKAGFGIDGDLRSNFINGVTLAGNDDWFVMNPRDTSAKFVIDTTGAAALLAGYQSDASPWPRRSAPQIRRMSMAPYSIVNNRLWLDAMWLRDFHGTDSTAFTSGGDKNGMHPSSWTGGVASVPDKNDILDIMVHIRRSGTSSADSLWFFGGISVDNTNGNRYFDFELYQTDITFNRATGQWNGFGPDAGHTSWVFDASGNVQRPGDIIFSADYQNSMLSNIQARIWVSRTVWQTTTPTAFDWGGDFDGATTGSAFGYASIVPKTSGAYYTGIGSPANTWTGPFGLVLQNNTMATSYIAEQYMEFSVNLTKLGLDPISRITNDYCGQPFSRLLIKTRTSASFTSELKDFVAPTDFFVTPEVELQTQTPSICNTGSIARIDVIDPIPTSTYLWSTPNGRIVGAQNGPFIYVDTPGIYICRQYLQSGCALYAEDTIVIASIPNCKTLDQNLTAFTAVRSGSDVRLSWTVKNADAVAFMEPERGYNGFQFEPIGRQLPQAGVDRTYYQNDAGAMTRSDKLYYRLRIQYTNGKVVYSPIIRIQLERTDNPRRLIIQPNPARQEIRMQYHTDQGGQLQLRVFDMSGKQVRTDFRNLVPGDHVISLPASDLPSGLYQVVATLGTDVQRQKLVLER